MRSSKSIALDIGGSHVSASLIDLNANGRHLLNIMRKEMDAFEKTPVILDSIADCITQLINETTPDFVGIAFPGPFNYEKGVSAIAGVGGKFEQLFGLHVKAALQDLCAASNFTIHFANDAHCFAIGAYQRYQLNSNKALFLTLGTGFGSAFMMDGSVEYNHPAFLGSEGFFTHSFLNGTADDYFSSRWFLNEYKLKTGKTIQSVKALAALNDDTAISIFNQFGSNLGSFLLPVLSKFECDELVIGGNICRSSLLFLEALKTELQKLNKPLNIIFCDDTEECILTGAALLAEKEHNSHAARDLTSLRKTTQPLLPVSLSLSDTTGYDVFPSMPSKSEVYQGFNSLADKIYQHKTIIIDGYGGVLWEHFREQLHRALQAKNIKIYWYDIDAGLKSPENINALIEGSMNGDDPVFGKKYTGELMDFFDRQYMQMIQPDLSADLCILYGTGAALSNWQGLLIYIDVPKNEIQYRMRAGSATNLGSKTVLANTQTYKRFYFVDWPVLSKHKEQLLPKIDIITDEQRINEITWMPGNDFRNMLNEILHSPLRARPWFEAGIWGGHWMKKNIQELNENEINYAWSFELITPENGIVIEGNKNLLEVSFDFLLFYDNKKLMGKAANRFGKEFPIRFDFLDTYAGANLSIQCHPRTGYIRARFGESFTQDETYYIMDCEPDAKVYLGFQDDIDPAKFKQALFDAQNNSVELPVEKFVQKHDAHKHELFLIPNATIHASGKNNMVLEISSTPYIFTFKMYDWLRLDLTGQPRPINIEHAFNNLDFERRGDYVSRQLISKPQLSEEWDAGKKFKLPTHEEHFYAIDRYEFTGTIHVKTNGQFNICMLVEGDSIDVIAEDKTSTFSYAETFVIPAAVKEYEVTYSGAERAFLVVAYIKEECC